MLIALMQRHPTAITLILAGLAVAALAGLGRLQTQADYRVYFDPDDPLLALEQSVQARFGHSDSALLVLEGEPGTLLSGPSVAAYRELERRLGWLPGVDRVAGFYQFTDAPYGFEQEEAEDLFAEPADRGLDLSPEARLQRLQAHSRGRDLVSRDGRHALIEVGVRLPGEDSAGEVRQLMAGIRELVNGLLLEPGLVKAVSYSGAPVLNHAYIDVVRHDLGLFVPGLFGLMGLALLLMLRNWRLVVLLLAGGLLSAATAMGVAGWAGWTLAAINAFTPVIIVSLQLAAAMHLVVSYLQQRAEQLAPAAAMQRSLAFNLQATVLSALTTAGGFLLLSTSPSPPIRVVGYCVAVGVGTALLFNLVVLPQWLPRLKLPEQQIRAIAGRLTTRPLMAWLIPNKRVVLALSLTLGAAAVFALAGARIDDRVYSYFPDEHEFSRGTRQLDRRFDGCVRLSYVLAGTGEAAALTESYASLQTRFRDWLSAQPGVGAVRDIYGLIEREDLPFDTAIGHLRRNGVEALNVGGLLTPDLASSRVEVILAALNSSELLSFDARARRWLQHHAGDIRFEGGTGPDLVFAALGQRNAQSMFVSLAAALMVIGLLVGLLFRDFYLGLLGLACNLLPLVLVYGVWFAAGGFITLGAAVVLGMIMGIVVDDTLHVLCKFRGFVEQGGADPLFQLAERVLPAVWITSITLAVGLAVGMLSDFRPLRELSLLAVGIIVAALLVDALLLPAVLMLKRGRAK